MAKSSAKSKPTKKSVSAKSEQKPKKGKTLASKKASKSLLSKSASKAAKPKSARKPALDQKPSGSLIVRQSVGNSTLQSEPIGQRLTKTYLTKEELKHFQLVLLEKRVEVLKDLDIMRTSLQDENNSEEMNSSYSMHMADHGTETLDREQRFMFIARDERYLGYIDKALERIKNGTYGICAKSGLPIPKERLEAVPHTAVRIEYKNR